MVMVMLFGVILVVSLVIWWLNDVVCRFFIKVKILMLDLVFDIVMFFFVCWFMFLYELIGLWFDLF